MSQPDIVRPYRDPMIRPLMESAPQVIDAMGPLVFEMAGLDATSLLPIAATTQDRDVLVTEVVDGVQAPTVVWMAGGEIERFGSFTDFFLAMIAYNELELARLRGE